MALQFKRARFHAAAKACQNQYSISVCLSSPLLSRYKHCAIVLSIPKLPPIPPLNPFRVIHLQKDKNLPTKQMKAPTIHLPSQMSNALGHQCPPPAQSADTMSACLQTTRCAFPAAIFRYSSARYARAAPEEMSRFEKRSILVVAYNRVLVQGCKKKASLFACLHLYQFTGNHLYEINRSGNKTNRIACLVVQLVN